MYLKSIHPAKFLKWHAEQFDREIAAILRDRPALSPPAFTMSRYITD